MIDVYSRRVIGWQLASHMRTDLVLDALRMALGTRRHGAALRLVHHTDQGSPSTRALTTHRSSTITTCWPRSGASATRTTTRSPNHFVDSFKTELIADRVWRLRTQLEPATVEYIGWFNTARLHSALAYLTPIEYEQRYTAIASRHETPPAINDHTTPNPAGTTPPGRLRSTVQNKLADNNNNKPYKPSLRETQASSLLPAIGVLARKHCEPFRSLWPPRAAKGQ